MTRRLIIALLVAFAAVACAHQTESTPAGADDPDAIHLKPLYARGFDIYRHNDYVEVVLLNPWKYSEVITRYFLIRSDSVATPDNGRRIRVPLRRVASTSVTQYEFLDLIGEINSVAGICQPELAYNPTIRRNYAAGRIQNLGDAYNINREKVVLLHPDALFATLYGPASISKQLTDDSSTPTIYDNEWTESTLLARAEWIKFIAAFYCKSDAADSLFCKIDSAYAANRNLAANVTARKTVMLGNNYRGTWYMPGGQSYMGRLLRDAGAAYAFAADTSNVSLPLNFETVLKTFSHADVWLNAPTRTIDELLRLDERHSLFAPTHTGEVYAFMRRVNGDGANDFWESGVAHPDVILRDFIWALYPELLPDYRPVYIIKCPQH